MKKILLFAFPVLLLAASCGQSDAEKKAADSLAATHAKDSLRENIRKAELVLKNRGNDYDQKTVNAVIKAYTDFTNKYPNDSLTPDYLLQAATKFGMLQDHRKSAELLEVILERYPNFRKYRETASMAAHIYDAYLENVNNGGDRAKELYQFIINKYPGTRDAEDAAVMIKYVGLPDSIFERDMLLRIQQQEQQEHPSR